MAGVGGSWAVSLSNSAQARGRGVEPRRRVAALRRICHASHGRRLSLSAARSRGASSRRAMPGCSAAPSSTSSDHGLRPSLSGRAGISSRSRRCASARRIEVADQVERHLRRLPTPRQTRGVVAARARGSARRATPSKRCGRARGPSRRRPRSSGGHRADCVAFLRDGAGRGRPAIDLLGGLGINRVGRRRRCRLPVDVGDRSASAEIVRIEVSEAAQGLRRALFPRRCATAE